MLEAYIRTGEMMFVPQFQEALCLTAVYDLADFTTGLEGEQRSAV